MARPRLYNTTTERREAKRRQQRARYRRKKGLPEGTVLGNRDYVVPVEVPDAVLAEREGTFAPRTVTAEILGDPPPGRSALDKYHRRTQI